MNTAGPDRVESGKGPKMFWEVGVRPMGQTQMVQPNRLRYAIAGALKETTPAKTVKLISESVLMSLLQLIQRLLSLLVQSIYVAMQQGTNAKVSQAVATNAITVLTHVR